MLEVRDDVVPHAGERAVYGMKVAELANECPVVVPVIGVSGTDPGPTIVITGAMHGDEVLGADVIRRSLLRLEPAGVHGTVIGLPLLNVPAVATRTRRSATELYPGPHDMNRVFSGSDRGVLAERIAAFVSRVVFPRADYMFDLHCASVGGEWVGYSAVPSRSACQTWIGE